jgi:hypothetical protein
VLTLLPPSAGRGRGSPLNETIYLAVDYEGQTAVTTFRSCTQANRKRQLLVVSAFDVPHSAAWRSAHADTAVFGVQMNWDCTLIFDVHEIFGPATITIRLMRTRSLASARRARTSWG